MYYTSVYIYFFFQLQSGTLKWEGFIRTPVTLFVKFPMAVDISHIILGRRNDARYLTKLSLFTEINANLCSKEEKPPLSSTDKRATFGIGRFYPTEAIIHLQNKQYKNYINSPFPALISSPSIFLDQLKHPSKHCLDSVNQLEIKIEEVRPTGPPILSGLEIWGQPSVFLNQKIKLHVLEEWKKFVTSCATYTSIVQYKPKFYNSVDVEHIREEKRLRKAMKGEYSFEFLFTPLHQNLLGNNS